MDKLSVEEEVKHKLIEAKYQYPATCTTYDKEGNITSKRVVTHSLKATQELIKLQPSLAQVINTYDDDDVVKAPETIQQMVTSLGK